jgi:glycosidase
MRVRAGPTIYEINTAAWLQRLGEKYGQPVGLGDVPGLEWDALAALPVDAVWLMGVWQRSPIGRTVALAVPQLLAAYRSALPDVHEDDVLGSPYCVRDYVVDERFGGPDGLAGARQELAERDLALILDYVPNHVAADHPWVIDRPDYFLAGSDAELAAHPEEFMELEGVVFAKGRDPYFEPWQDVLQLNAFSPALREAAADTVTAIGNQCDGVRCDMAMLMTNEVFARTWGERAGATPEADFWPLLIARCKQVHPGFLFMAEVYWDMEWTLQQEGFDLCYDKRLYDSLVRGPADSVRGHLQADGAYQQRLIRFIENHDEPRAALTFGPARGRAAAVVMSTLQGARLYHDGQLEGFRTHLPIQLGRGPHEPSDHDLRTFYRRLLRATAEARAGCGDWRLCDCTGCPEDPHPQFVAWCWSNPRARYLVVVNLSPADAEGRVRLPWRDLPGRTWGLADRLSEDRFTCSGDELARKGLRVTLAGWGSRFLALET